MVVEISKSDGIELNPGCRDDRGGRLYVDGWERKCTSKARIRYYTPEHGSWLVLAEIEQSVMARQALSRRTPNREAIIQRTTAWQKQRNAADASVGWQFTTEDARVKLKRLHPKLNN